MPVNKTAKDLALQEIADEVFREQVEAEKVKLKQRKWWHKFIPKIIIKIVPR